MFHRVCGGTLQRGVAVQGNDEGRDMSQVTITVMHDISATVLGRYILDGLEGGHVVVIKDGRNGNS